MIRIDPTNWTADFRIARALSEAYFASGLDDVLFLCFGDPDDRIARIGPIIGDETLKYFPHVIGTSEAPLTAANLPERAQEVRRASQGKFLVSIEAGKGPLEVLGSIEITDRDPGTVAPLGEAYARISDVTVSVLLVPAHPGFRVGEEAARVDAGAPREEEPAGGGILAGAAMEVSSDTAFGPEGRRPRFKPLRPDQVDARAVQKRADTVIDGILRFLSKIGKQEI